MPKSKSELPSLPGIKAYTFLVEATDRLRLAFTNPQGAALEAFNLLDAINALGKAMDDAPSVSFTQKSKLTVAGEAIPQIRHLSGRLISLMLINIRELFFKALLDAYIEYMYVLSKAQTNFIEQQVVKMIFGTDPKEQQKEAELMADALVVFLGEQRTTVTFFGEFKVTISSDDSLHEFLLNKRTDDFAKQVGEIKKAQPSCIVLGPIIINLEEGGDLQYSVHGLRCLFKVFVDVLEHELNGREPKAFVDDQAVGEREQSEKVPLSEASVSVLKKHVQSTGSRTDCQKYLLKFCHLLNGVDIDIERRCDEAGLLEQGLEFQVMYLILCHLSLEYCSFLMSSPDATDFDSKLGLSHC